RYVCEAALGVAIARRTGMRAAAADLLMFVDDDTVLDPGYLAEALRIACERPELGVWGSGVVTPEFEVPPSQYVKKLVPWLTLRECSKEQWGNVLPCVDVTPWGAGLCLRATVAAAYLRHCDTATIQLVSRRGRQRGRQVLMSGEDVEMSFVACQ